MPKKMLRTSPNITVYDSDVHAPLFKEIISLINRLQTGSFGRTLKKEQPPPPPPSIQQVLVTGQPVNMRGGQPARCGNHQHQGATRPQSGSALPGKRPSCGRPRARRSLVLQNQHSGEKNCPRSPSRRWGPSGATDTCYVISPSTLCLQAAPSFVIMNLTGPLPCG